MTTDQQVRRLMSLIEKGVPLSRAAAQAGMSEPTARRYRRLGKLPSETRERREYRTRADPFEALSEGLQSSLWRLGGVPVEHRTDNLSAATHELARSGGRAFTARYEALLAHYAIRGSRNTPGRAHENGDAESSHGGLKGALDQRLRLRGSRDFTDREAWMALVQAVVDGRKARVRLYAERLEVRHDGQLVATPARVRGNELAGIDYRHLVHSLVRKPGAFARYVYREALHPTPVFRRAYDALVERSAKWADLEYVRILHLAASTMQCEV